MVNNFIKAFAEQHPEYTLKLEDFEHPMDKNTKYMAVYINDSDTKIVLCSNDLVSDDKEEINELVKIVYDHVNKR